MAREIGFPQKGPNIRPADASVFKKTPGNRGYNAIVKSQNTAQNLMRGRQELPTQRALDGGLDPATPVYSQQTLDMIKGCLDLADKNLKKEDVISYLTTTFGEEQAQQILQERYAIQQQLVQQYNEIINPKDQPKAEE